MATYLEICFFLHDIAMLAEKDNVLQDSVSRIANEMNMNIQDASRRAMDRHHLRNILIEQPVRTSVSPRH